MVTLTYGTTGTYATLRAAWQALPGTLSDDYTLMQVGASVDSLGIYSADGKPALNGHSLTLTSNIPMNVDPLVGWLSSAPDIELDYFGPGSFILDNFHGVSPTATGFIYIGLSGDTPNGAANLIQIKNSILSARIVQVTGVRTPTVMSPLPEIQVVNNKITGGVWALYVRPGFYNPGNTRVYIENNAFQTLAAGIVGIGAVNVDGVTSVVYRNNTGLLFDSSIPFIGYSAHAGVTYTSEQNASSPALNNGFPGIAYTNIGVPADILNDDDTMPDYMDTAGTSALYTAGAVPQLAANPYTTAPYPIGIPGPAPTPPGASQGLWIPAFVGGI